MYDIYRRRVEPSQGQDNFSESWSNQKLRIFRLSQPTIKISIDRDNDFFESLMKKWGSHLTTMRMSYQGKICDMIGIIHGCIWIVSQNYHGISNM